MKHLRRFSNGCITIAMFVSFILLMGMIFKGIDAFVDWKYRNNTLIFVGVMISIYLIGCFIEVVGLDKGKH